MNKIAILVSLVFLNGCVSADFEKGVRHIEPTKYSYDHKTRQRILNKLDKNPIYLRFFQIISKQNINNFYNGAIRNYFESQDDKNQQIFEMPLKLIKPTSGDELCILKWHNKYGYNAIAETKRQIRPGFWNWLFRNHELIVTGKVIEVNE